MLAPPQYELDQRMQQRSSEHWAAPFRKLIAGRADVEQFPAEEEAAEFPES